MIKIKTDTNKLEKQPKKYTRVTFTHDAPGMHRFLMHDDGTEELKIDIGKEKDFSMRKFRTLVRSVVQMAKSHQIEHLALSFNIDQYPELKAQDESHIYSTIAENCVLAAYDFIVYKSKKSPKKTLKEIVLCNITTKAAKNGVARGVTVGESANVSRDVANTPARDMTPKKLAAATKKIFSGTKVKVKILGEKELRKLKMNLLLAVGEGTKEETQLIVMEYDGSPTSPKSKPIVLVGKGVTYDTGGLNVKPTGFMHDMHMDMSGGAAVIGTLRAVSKLGLKQRVIGIIPAAENAVSDTSMRAGDIVTSMSGKTVEIVHTDAEGRLILADALTYADRYKPGIVIDVATLTGAAAVALGQHASAVLTKHDELREKILNLSEKSGDYMWPLPLWEEYREHIKSARADIANIAPSFSRYGGTIEGGTFLSHFVGSWPWAHIDIAPRMDSNSLDKLAKGSTGEPVRMLTMFVEEHTS